MIVGRLLEGGALCVDTGTLKPTYLTATFDIAGILHASALAPLPILTEVATHVRRIMCDKYDVRLNLRDRTHLHARLIEKG